MLIVIGVAIGLAVGGGSSSWPCSARAAAGWRRRGGHASCCWPRRAARPRRSGARRRSRPARRRSSSGPRSRRTSTNAEPDSQRRGAARAREADVERTLTELTRREQGVADREVHAKELQEELKQAKEEQLQELERISGMTVNEAKAHCARALRGAGPARARPPRPPGRGGGADRGEAAGAEPRRGRAPARGGEPRLRDDRVGRRAALRRHEGPDHRPRRAATSGRSST